MSKCPVCGGENGYHKSTDMMICQSRYYSRLTKEDWVDLYNFMRLIYLPFVHGIMARAKARGKQKPATLQHGPED